MSQKKTIEQLRDELRENLVCILNSIPISDKRIDLKIKLTYEDDPEKIFEYGVEVMRLLKEMLKGASD